MNVPKVESGKYIMRVSLNSKSIFGALSSEREVIIDEDNYDNLWEQYDTALKKDDKDAAFKVRQRVFTKHYKDRVKPGQVILTRDPRQNNRGVYPGINNLWATFKWLAERDHIKIVVDVTDAYFSTDAPKDKPWEASSVEIFVTPSGFSQDMNQLILVPDNADGNMTIHAMGDLKDVDKSKIGATWKRTHRGYSAEVTIPWSLLKGYDPKWTVLPIDGMINSKTPNGRCQIAMKNPGSPWSWAKDHVLLVRD